MALPTLPLDILDLIAEAVTSFPPAISTSTLISLSLVSRAWSAAAQPALHRTPFFSFDAPDTTPPRTFTRLQNLLRTLRSRPDLPVLAFDVGKYTSRCLTEAKVDRRSVSRLAIELVAACPNLRKLAVPFVTQADKHELLSALRRCSLLKTFIFGEGVSHADPWVVNVDIGIKDQWGTAIWTRSDFVSLAASWASLRRFVLQARARDPSSEPDGPVPWHLESFELSLLKNHKLPFTYLDKLLSNCRTSKSLRHLVLKEHQLKPGDLVRLVEAYGHGLVRLETTTANRFARNNALISSIPTFCPSLVTLRLGTAVYDLPFVLSELSHLSSLRHLTLDTVLLQALPGRSATLVGLVERFPALEELKLTPGCHGNQNDDLERFQRFRQFQFKLYSLRRAVEQAEMGKEVTVGPPFS
ncbi:hypothetical protein JCM8547_000222 [Rhodosporidiobolus lusitaniae]